ncbi:MAG: acetyl-CoA carboxylase biotin carboxyl carrier protein [Eubacteriales bacterium]|nr:acetyl-CoA carboxylase biotin carboxyl carrier protein [Eubacteriales bacterium]
MDIKQIQELAEIFCNYHMNLLEISENDLHIRMERSPAQTSAAAPRQEPPAPPTAQAPGDAEVDFNDITEIKSPMAGVFYAAASPDAPAYVGIGSKVKKGDTLCIIEAMKLMNEIAAEQDGEVVDVCAQNGQIVEYGQTMFKIF